MPRPAPPDDITSHTLRSPGVEVTALSVGCAVQSWIVDGVPVVLGFADPMAYLDNPVSMGVLIGRVVNRISNATLPIGGQTYPLDQNHGPHTIHGGSGGFGWQNWAMAPVSDSEVRLSLTSLHLDQGFPGEVECHLKLSLQGRALIYEIEAHSTKPTLLNLAQHQYFNLMGAGDIRDHHLQIDAALYTPTGPDYRPTGDVREVTGTRYDYRTSRCLGAADPDKKGCDASLILDHNDGPQVRLIAPNGLTLQMTTNQPCVQLYTSGGLGPGAAAGPGAPHEPFGAVCLEAQGYPDAIAQGFPHRLYGPGETYSQRTVIEIS